MNEPPANNQTIFNAAEQLALAIGLHQRGQLGQAHAIYEQLLRINPAHADALHLLGVIAHQTGQAAKAIELIDRAVAVNPGSPAFYANRGLAHQALKHLDAAIADFTRAISLKPDYLEAYSNRGLALREIGKLDAAIADFTRALSVRSDYAEAYNNRGVALREFGMIDAAIADFTKAISLKPDYVEAYSNRGDALQERKELDAAIADYGRAVSLRPDYAEAHYNLGNALRERGRPDAAIAAYDKAVALRPNYAEAHLNKALGLLLRGDLEEGFRLYEWRWQVPDLNSSLRRFVQPLWLGQDSLRHKRILLHGEQGLGDTIQFCRYAPLLAKQQEAQVILVVPQPLTRLLKSLEGISEIVAEGEALPSFDYHCPLLSLPAAFKTSINTIPDPTPYLFADPVKARDWRERMGASAKLKVGVVWSGGFRIDAPRGWDAVNERRNIRLETFARALNGIDIDFFSVQKGDPAEAEIRGHELEYWPRGNFHNFADSLKDFSDTAALVANLDLVVTVDTATAHLAAALGKPTWILVRFDTDWRWLLNRDDSPWYRSVRLYRQDDSQKWEPVLQRLADRLMGLLR